MRNQPEPDARVTLNGKAVPVKPALADCAGPRGEPALTVTVTVKLDLDDVAAAVMSFLNTGGTLAEMIGDEDAWLVVADMLVNDGIGPVLCGIRDEMTVGADRANPLAVLCRDRVQRLLATSGTAGTPAQRVPARSNSRTLTGVSR